VLAEQLDPRASLQLAHRARHALRRSQTEQNVHVIGSRDHVEQDEIALSGALTNAFLQSLHVSLAQHRPATTRAPGHQIVELTAVHRLPTSLEGLLDFGSQIAFHDSCLLRGTLYVCAAVGPQKRERAAPGS